MPGWTLVDTHPTQGRTFQRRLDVLELWFFWHGIFNGATDGLQYCELRLFNGSEDAHLFSEANIVKAWLSTKRRYPLTGAIVRGADMAPLRLTDGDTGFASEPHFVVRECDLGALRPHEIVYGNLACAEEAQQYMTAIMDRPRPLSEELLAQLYVLRETNIKKTDVLHLMIHMAHCVSDRVAMNTFVRCLLDTLGRGGEPEPVQMPLEDRLAMATPSMELGPSHLHSLSPAKRRWRRAIGMVIFQLKMAKRQGGHTLPCHLTRSTPHVPATSGLLSTSLTRTQTTAVTANCRLHDITFGSAFLALTQVAMTRVLCRRYFRGEISEEEWAHRKRQPYISGGPFNLRPYLDKTWFERGGGGESMLCISLFFYQLPFMTGGETMEKRQRVLSDGAPPLSGLLTFDRFLHRVWLVKKQMMAFSNHPLFFEMVHAATLAEVDHARLGALQWMKRAGTAGNDHDTHKNSDEILAMTDVPMIWAFGGSSAGNLDFMSPMEYPLSSTHPLSPYSFVQHPLKAGYATPASPSECEAEMTPRIVVENVKIHIHARPAELYLTADSLSGQLNMNVVYDRNVFEEGVVMEWLDEVKGAILWYLGRTHQSHRAPQVRSDGDRQMGRVESVQAKL